MGSMVHLVLGLGSRMNVSVQHWLNLILEQYLNGIVMSVASGGVRETSWNRIQFNYSNFERSHQSIAAFLAFETMPNGVQSVSLAHQTHISVDQMLFKINEFN